MRAVGDQKRCSKCRETKHVSEFNRNASEADGLYPQCKSCHRSSSKAYTDANMKNGTAMTGQDSGKATAACESFVQSDLMTRGFEVTKPLSPTAKHDLHIELPGGWKGVQVKAIRLNTKTGAISFYGECQSPILALVLLPRHIFYVDGTEPLPEELCLSTNTDASTVTRDTKGTLRLMKGTNSFAENAESN
jgi:hypothetical protein